MLLVMDVGNTDTTLGAYDGDQLIHHWRVDSERRRTPDEYAVLLKSLMELRGISLEKIDAIAIASVVPPLTQNLVAACERYIEQEPLVIGPGIKTGMPIVYDNPREVGADRIVNAVAAYDRTSKATIVVDFGTATTFDFVSEAGEYVGGIIAPGLHTSADALFARAAKLPRVEIARPPRVVGRNTVHAMQAGLFFGYAAMVDGLVARVANESGGDPHVIATGGLAHLIATETSRIDEVDEDLTLRGLRLIWQRNQA